MYTAYKLDTLMKYGLKFTWVKEKHGLGMYEALYDYCAHAEPLESTFDEDNALVHTKVKFTILDPKDVQELMQYIDLIVDGDYQQDKRLTNDKYMHEGWFVGSSNQRVIFAPASAKIGELLYLHADQYNKQRLSSNHCKCCGHELTRNPAVFCNSLCAERYKARKKEVENLGGV